MSTLQFHELENLYDELAMAIDATEPGRESVFLAKLVLSLSQEFGHAQRVSQLIQDCLHEPAANATDGTHLI